MHTVESPHLFVARRDWSFHRKGHQDQERHKEKIKEVVKDNLDKVIADGNIITADPNSKKAVKIPMRSLVLPRIRFKDRDNNEGVGSGDGDAQPGDIIGRRPGRGRGGKGDEAGDQPGVDYYEAEVDLMEIQEWVFKDLGLPNLKPKPKQQIESEEIVFDDIRKHRSPSNLDIMRTVEANMRRNAQEHGKAEIKNITPDDYRRRTWREVIKPHNNALVIFEGDDSASMDDMKKYLMRAYGWWTVNFLRTRYPKVETLFIAHDTQASVVTEEQFFSRGSGGGTMCSSAHEESLKQIDASFPHDQYNIYVVQFSDGDNWMADDKKCVDLVNKMFNEKDVNQFAFVQVGRSTESNLMREYRQGVKDDRFTSAILSKKEDVLPALKKVFPREEELKVA